MDKAAVCDYQTLVVELDDRIRVTTSQRPQIRSWPYLTGFVADSADPWRILIQVEAYYIQ